MARMKSRNEWPPGGWLYTQSQIPQWSAPHGSFTMVAQAIYDLRRGNPALTAQYSLSTDIRVIENELDEFNANRCLSHGWNDFVENSAGPPSPVFPSPQRLSRLGVVATSLKHAVVGVATIRDHWLGDSLKPVEHSLAEKRAITCVDCPQNGDPNLIERLTAEAAKVVKGLMQAKEDMELKTSVDDKIHVCKACGCFLGLKIWTPLAHILKNQKPDERAKLDPRCWILKDDK